MSHLHTRGMIIHGYINKSGWISTAYFENVEKNIRITRYNREMPRFVQKILLEKIF